MKKSIKNLLSYLIVIMLCLNITACIIPDVKNKEQNSTENSSSNHKSRRRKKRKKEKETANISETKKELEKTNQNDLFSGTSWTAEDDNSKLILDDKGNFFWYQDDSVHDDNYFAGKYTILMGADAFNFLTHDLKQYGITEEELMDVILRSDKYSLETLTCIDLFHESFLYQGKEMVKKTESKYYFGFILDYDDTIVFDIANMQTCSYYLFIKD